MPALEVDIVIVFEGARATIVNFTLLQIPLTALRPCHKHHQTMGLGARTYLRLLGIAIVHCLGSMVSQILPSPIQ